MYAGVDGCPKGWVALVLPDERIVEGFQQLAGLLEALNGCEVIAVDMPLNAPESVNAHATCLSGQNSAHSPAACS